MRVCYFGTYEPEYSRNQTLINGLKRKGIEVIECQKQFRGYKKFSKLIKKLKDKHSKIGSYNVMIVGYPGHWVMPLAREISQKPIIFDAFISFFEKAREEKVPLWKKYWYKYLDKKSCLLADKVLLDTEAHIEYFVKQFGLPLDKFEKILVGTDEEIFYPRKAKNLDKKFKVLFYAKFLPLHGGEYVVKTAKILEKDKNILFTLVGSGDGFEKCRNLARKIKVQNIVWQGRVPYLKLPQLIAEHNISLGIFGGTKKSKRVIPNKVYEAMAMKKAFVTGNSPAVRELLTNRENGLFCQMANADDLAQKIKELKENRNLRERIAINARKTFEKEANSLVLGEKLKTIIYSLV